MNNFRSIGLVVVTCVPFTLLSACSPDAGSSDEKAGPSDAEQVVPPLESGDGASAAPDARTTEGPAPADGRGTSGSDGGEAGSRIASDGSGKKTDRPRKGAAGNGENTTTPASDGKRSKKRTDRPAPSKRAPGKNGKKADVQVSDRELRKLARLYPKMRRLGMKTKKKMDKTVKASKLKKKRFREISQSKRSKKKKADITNKEEKQYRNLVKRLRKIGMAGRKKHMQLIREAGFKPRRFDRISKAIQRDPELKSRLKKKIQTLRSGRTGSNKRRSPGTGGTSRTENDSSASGPRDTAPDSSEKDK